MTQTVEAERPATLVRRFVAPARGGDTERAQSFVRLALTVISASYLVVGLITGEMARSSGTFLISYMAAFLVVALVLHAAIVSRPGVSHARRGFAMLIDYSSTTIMMLFGGAFTAPLFAVLLWITVGYGMRYGSRYLAAGTGMALVCVAGLFALSEFWRANPFLVAMIALMALVVPLYAQLLMMGTQMAHDAATAASQAKSQFLAQASHDLRQPIHAISLFTACLRDARLTDDQHQLVENIDRSLRSVSMLFRSLLDVSKLESGRLVPKLEPVALNAIILAVAEQNEQVARWRGCTIRIVPTTLVVRTDPSLVTVMLQNLVSNALKYSNRTDIVIGCRRRQGRASLVVVDRGRGIAPAEQKRVFEEFYRIREPGEDLEGVGIGLSIVDRMASLIDATVTLRSNVGKGTSISIGGLPISSPTPSAGRIERSRARNILQGRRVLLIEDSRSVLVATKWLLESWGCDVTAETGMPDDLNAPDIVLTDFDLGESVDAATIINRIRQQACYAVPAIVMTGHDENRVRASIGDTTIPVLPKPVRPAELRAALLSVLIANPAAMATARQHAENSP